MADLYKYFYEKRIDNWTFKKQNWNFQLESKIDERNGHGIQSATNELIRLSSRKWNLLFVVKYFMDHSLTTRGPNCHQGYDKQQMQFEL